MVKATLMTLNFSFKYFGSSRISKSLYCLEVSCIVYSASLGKPKGISKMPKLVCKPRPTKWRYQTLNTGQSSRTKGILEIWMVFRSCKTRRTYSGARWVPKIWKCAWFTTFPVLTREWGDRLSTQSGMKVCFCVSKVSQNNHHQCGCYQVIRTRFLWMQLVWLWFLLSGSILAEEINNWWPGTSSLLSFKEFGKRYFFSLSRVASFQVGFYAYIPAKFW